MNKIKYITSPYLCLYWTTYRCNSKCKYCNIWKNPLLRNVPDAKFSDVKKNLDDIKKIGVRKIDFTGGEPLLNKELINMLSYAKELGFFIKLSTNGYLYPDKAYELKDLANIIYFSLDTTTKDEYFDFRGIDGFEKVIKSIQIAKELKQKFCLIYTITNDNIKNIQGLTKFCIKNKIPIYFNHCFSYFENPDLNKENIKIVEKYFFHPYIKMDLPLLDFHFKGGNDIRNPSCRSGISTIDISPDNYLMIPCFHRYQKKVKLDGNLYSLYKSSEWDELYRNVGKYNFCNNCSIDCYFGKSFVDGLTPNFFKRYLTLIKYFLENHRL